MKKLNPEYVEKIMAVTNACNFFQLMRMQFEKLSWGEAEILVSAGEKHLQPYGIVHGGVCASIIDAACFWAVFSQAPEDAGITTVDLKLNYLAPVVSGVLHARGACIKLGKTMGLGSATVYRDDGSMVAHGTSTVMLLPGMELAGGMPKVPKYI